ncbi:MAG TPA: homogentisate 1,2-dioxygenase [Acidimicrobiales bacterium]|nr:homogentisate 1,2-dioxygenase [Acidimicrobiales bacterium]
MSFYVKVGDVPRKRHTWHRSPQGDRLAEELMGEEGFRGASSLLYHLHSPSAITGVEAAEVCRSPLAPNQPLRPWHIRPPREAPSGADLVTGREVLLGNDNVTICRVTADRTSELYRNAAGDEVVYLQSGTALFESVFGSIEATEGDYVLIPASTTHRWVLSGRVEALVVEAAGHVSVPGRYLTSRGQLREGAPFSERDIRPPQGPLVAEDNGPTPVLVRTRAGWTRHCHAHHPFDVVGWDGCAWPFALSIRDFEPIVGRIHQPPPVHQTFEGPGFVVCSFVPRPFDFDPDAVKVPYHHANVDSDEVLFYSGGSFMSRRGAGIGIGSLTLHPAGFVHGPQPGSVEASVDAERTDETAVMLDTFSPLMLSAAARESADEGYAWSWATPDPR